MQPYPLKDVPHPHPYPIVHQPQHRPHLSHHHPCRLQILQLQCKKCKAFYIGETGQMLSKRVNGHRSTCTVANSDLPVPIHTQSHQLPFQECWSVRVMHKLPDTTLDHFRCQHETAYQLVLKSRQFPGINIR